MDTITQALRKFLPAEHVAEVAKAVENVIAEQFSVMEQEFATKLENAYAQLTEEKEVVEATAFKGYQQAYEIIASLMNRLDEQAVEFEHTMNTEFGKAYSEIEKHKNKNNEIEDEVYDEFNKKLAEMKDIMVDKLDQFMSLQENELYEAAKREVLSDPRILEQRVAVEKMAEILSDYISNDQVAGVSSGKLEDAHKQIEDLKGKLRVIEGRNVNLKRKNEKLEEQVSEAHAVITEATKVERRERVNRRGIASGRGQRVVNEQLINEFVAPTSQSNGSQELVEANDPLNDLLVLSGLDEQFYESAQNKNNKKK